MLFRGIAILVLASFSMAGCYNTYYLSQDTFAALQKKSEQNTRTVATKDSQQVVVTEDSKLFARSEGGRRYQLTPFNFKMTKSQLVASDRDYILMLDELESYEVDKLSTIKTVGLIGIGVAAVAGFITYMAVRYGGKSIGDSGE